MNNNYNTIYSIQMLRAFAAMIVVVAHAQVFLKARGFVTEVNPLIDIGRAGVDLFFVISGFIIVYISSNKFQKKYAVRDFLVKRIIRVVPIYWVYTGLLALLMLLLPHLVSHGKTVAFEHFLASLFFIPWENSIGNIKPVLPVGWTLNFEMYFYLLFSLLLFLPRKLFIVNFFFILGLGFLSGLSFSQIPVLMFVITSPLLLEFFAGCIVGLLFINGKTIRTSYAFLIVFVAILAFLLSSTDGFSNLHRVIKWGIPAVLLIYGFLSLEKNNSIRINRFLVRLGDSSYSLYLTHIFSINALGYVWLKVFSDYFHVYIFLALITSLIAGHIAYLIMEKPLISVLNKKYSNYMNHRV